MGEYFHLGMCKVRVIGYNAAGVANSVIVDHPYGRNIRYIDPTDVLMVVSRTGRYVYAKWEDLR